MQRDLDRVLRQALLAVAARDLAGQDPADRAVLVLAVDLDLDPLAALERGLSLADDLVVEVVVEHRVLRPHAPARPLGRAVGLREQVREVDPARLPVVDRLLRLEHVGAADHVLELREAHLRHVPAHLLGHEEEEVDDLLRLALELLDQVRVLRRDADRARVQVAGAHHDAAHRDQRGGGEAHLLRAEQRGDDDVAAGLHLAVGLDDDPVAQLVQHERLLGLGEADLPRHAGRLDRADGRRARAAVVARDHDVVGVRLRDARGDGARRRPRRRA